MKLTDQALQQAQLSIEATIGEAIRSLERTSIKIVLIVDKMGCLEGTVSDGDIRRGLLRGMSFSSSIFSIVHRNPLVVAPEMGREFVLQLMVVNKVQQIPVIDEQRQVIGLHLWDEINTPPDRSNIMVVMAGGRGTRLHPFTEDCPKPMLLVGAKPILEHILERAKIEGFQHFVFAINYLGHIIQDYFGDGARFGVKISYVYEAMPLGTAGALSLIEPIPLAPFIVTNGDVITDIKYSELLDFHARNFADATMAVRMHEWQHPYGVVQTDGLEIVRFEEKPIARTYINAGVYVLNPLAMESLANHSPCDMPMLFERLRINGRRTLAYPMHEPWLDIGRPIDLENANANIEFKSKA